MAIRIIVIVVVVIVVSVIDIPILFVIVIVIVIAIVIVLMGSWIVIAIVIAIVIVLLAIVIAIVLAIAPSCRGSPRCWFSAPAPKGPLPRRGLCRAGPPPSQGSSCFFWLARAIPRISVYGTGPPAS